MVERGVSSMKHRYNNLKWFSDIVNACKWLICWSSNRKSTSHVGETHVGVRFKHVYSPVHATTKVRSYSDENRDLLDDNLGIWCICCESVTTLTRFIERVIYIHQPLNHGRVQSGISFDHVNNRRNIHLSSRYSEETWAWPTENKGVEELELYKNAICLDVPNGEIFWSSELEYCSRCTSNLGTSFCFRICPEIVQPQYQPIAWLDSHKPANLNFLIWLG